MENEIMDYEEEVMDPEVEIDETETERSGMGTGAAMLLGAGLTIATGAVIKLGKKLYAACKAKKEQRKAHEEDLEDVADDEE